MRLPRTDVRLQWQLRQSTRHEPDTAGRPCARLPPARALRPSMDLDGRGPTRRPGHHPPNSALGRPRLGLQPRRGHRHGLQLPAHHRQPARPLARVLGAPRLLWQRRLRRHTAGHHRGRQRSHRFALDAQRGARAVLRALPEIQRQLRPQAAIRSALSQSRLHQGHLCTRRHGRRRQAPAPGRLHHGQLQLHDAGGRNPYPLLLVPDAYFRPG